MITKDVLDEVVGDVSFSAYRQISPDNDSKLAGDSKKVLVQVNFAGATLRSVFDRAFGAAVIAWANGQGRKHYSTIKEKVVVEFTAPAKRIETREEKIAKLVAGGYPIELATIAVDEPGRFIEMMKKVSVE